MAPILRLAGADALDGRQVMGHKASGPQRAVTYHQDDGCR